MTTADAHWVEHHVDHDGTVTAAWTTTVHKPTFVPSGTFPDGTPYWTDDDLVTGWFELQVAYHGGYSNVDPGWVAWIPSRLHADAKAMANLFVHLMMEPDDPMSHASPLRRQRKRTR
jgi:hypothetical protein